MPYDEKLAERVRKVLVGQPGLTERRMFGGVGFMLNGNMACGVNKDDLIVRLDPAEHDEAMARPHARAFDLSSRPAKGWLLVGAKGVTSEKDLRGWVEVGLRYALSLPPK